ncbi:MAG: aspartyl protease family protein [Phenylobacterium sp.]|uniref:aspartyl protease family protein n=1 Tax=Phenylobacterium sp. TaxID=1871053 RepID=UPI00391C29C0
MKPRRLLPLLLAAALAGCDGWTPPTPADGVEYRPEEAGTVDHAMCLLGFVAVPLRRLASGHQLVSGELNGKPATFVLDTGANVSVVDSAYAADFGLTPQRFVGGAAVGVGGGLKVSRSSIEELRLGGVDTRHRHLMLADLSQMVGALGRLSPEPIQGIIGQDLMREHRAVIDVARPMLYLQADDADPAPVPAERCGGQAAA